MVDTMDIVNDAPTPEPTPEPGQRYESEAEEQIGTAYAHLYDADKAFEKADFETARYYQTEALIHAVLAVAARLDELIDVRRY